MKRIVFVLVALSAIVVNNTFATSLRFESQNKVHAGEISPQTNLYTRSKINDHLLITTASVVQKSYGEQLIGMIYTPYSWVEIEGTAGIESTDTPLRVETSVYLTKGRLTVFGLYDYGKSGGFWKFQSEVKIIPSLSVGIYGHHIPKSYQDLARNPNSS